MPIKINDAQITNKLTQIREKLGLAPANFIPSPLDERIDSPVSPDEWDEIFHPSGLLISNGQPVFVYIRDHTIGEHSTPQERKKIHFAVCGTLSDMKRTGRFESRYRRTNRDDDKYAITIIRYGRPHEIEENLYPCQNCLKAVDYRCFKQLDDSKQRRRIVESFRAKDALELLWQQFQIFETQITPSFLRGAGIPTGYPKQWREISRKFREKENYTCADCGVCLRGAPRLCHVHHKDGDKNEVRFNKLECLCVLCHKKRHGHLPVNEFDAATIRRMQRAQGRA